MTENCKKTEKECIELQNKRLLAKIAGVKRALQDSIALDAEKKLTPEEMLAVRAGALAAFGYVDALLGGMGKRIQRNAELKSDYSLAIDTMDVGRSIQLESLERFGR